MTTGESHFFFTTTTLFTGASIWFLHGLAFDFAAMAVAEILFFGAIVLIGRRQRKNQPTWPIHLALSASIAVVASVALFQWPLRAAYAASRPAMERIAKELYAGRKFTGPIRVGAFLVERAEIREYRRECCCAPTETLACLWLHVDPTGDTGFIQTWAKHDPQWSTSLDNRWQFAAKMCQPPEWNARR
jgi:hypothetical protein